MPTAQSQPIWLVLIIESVDGQSVSFLVLIIVVHDFSSNFKELISNLSSEFANHKTFACLQTGVDPAKLLDSLSSILGRYGEILGMEEAAEVSG